MLPSSFQIYNTQERGACHLLCRKNKIKELPVARWCVMTPKGGSLHNPSKRYSPLWDVWVLRQESIDLCFWFKQMLHSRETLYQAFQCWQGCFIVRNRNLDAWFSRSACLKTLNLANEKLRLPDISWWQWNSPASVGGVLDMGIWIAGFSQTKPSGQPIPISRPLPGKVSSCKTTH